MNILYVGRFEVPYRSEVYIKAALEANGHTVSTCDLSKSKIKGVALQARKENVDFVLFSKTKDENTLRTIYQLKGQGILTVCWLFDLFGIPIREKTPPEFNCDIVFTTDGGEKTIERGHHTLRQGIHLPEAADLTGPVEGDKFPIVFVGHGDEEIQPGRGALIDFLGSRYSSDFTHLTETRGMDLTKILSTSGVVVGDSYPSERYWSNRIYEVTGRGGFLLHPETPGLEEEFTDGEHYISYERDNFDKLEDTIDDFLQPDNLEEREAIRMNGWRLTSVEYTYESRCSDLIDQICQGI